MSYTAFKDGYAIETTYGTSPITTAGDTAYLPGIISQTAKHPNVTWKTEKRAVGVGAYEVSSGDMWKAYDSRVGMWQVILQNGIPLWMVMGSSSTAGSDPYTHTITAGDLPSFTTHHERTGTGTDWVVQYTGCMVGNLTLQCSHETIGLLATVDWLCQDGVDPDLDGTNATLTNDPALPATSNSDPYLFSQLTRTWDYGGAGTSLDGLESVQLEIAPNIASILSHYWESGTNRAHVPRGYYQNPPHEYTLTMEYMPENDDIWDELVSTSNSKEMLFKWTRSTNDYIQITCTDCQVVEHETKTPEVNERLIEKVVMVPRSLSIEVKDSIAGSNYGE